MGAREVIEAEQRLLEATVKATGKQSDDPAIVDLKVLYLGVLFNISILCSACTHCMV